MINGGMAIAGALAQEAQEKSLECLTGKWNEFCLLDGPAMAGRDDT